VLWNRWDARYFGVSMLIDHDACSLEHSRRSRHAVTGVSGDDAPTEPSDWLSPFASESRSFRLNGTVYARSVDSVRPFACWKWPQASAGLAVKVSSTHRIDCSEDEFDESGELGAGVVDCGAVSASEFHEG
jgi:hypothetical protein